LWRPERSSKVWLTLQPRACNDILVKINKKIALNPHIFFLIHCGRERFENAFLKASQIR